jgi:Ca2+-binding RTX toxin-like protein
MALLGLNLNGLLGGVTDTVDDLLGDGLGGVVGDLVPGGLMDDLGETLEDVLNGDPADLLDDLLANDLLDLGLLQDVLGAAPGGGTLDLGSLDDLLGSVDVANLEAVLDDVFDTGLLGGTILDENALGDLGPVDLESTATFVTNLVGAALDVAGDTADVGLILDSLLAGDDDLVGDAGDNRIDGRAGDDSIRGLGGEDTLTGGDGGDTLRGGDGDDSLTGDAGSDKLFGDAGADTLNGGTSADYMAGGAGDDRYFVDHANDVVMEAAGQGRDLVYSSISQQLGSNVEQLYLLGSKDLSGVGNHLDNTLTGNSGDNVLRGEDGRDILFGRLGSDTLAGGAGNDVFRYELESESGIGAGERDIVVDFAKGDRFDFSRLDGDLDLINDQPFKFVGQSAFSGDGVGEIAYAKFNSSTLISVDADGDATVDMQIHLSGLIDFTRADFIL